jgi:hypothetical protein
MLLFNLENLGDYINSLGLHNNWFIGGEIMDLKC